MLVLPLLFALLSDPVPTPPAAETGSAHAGPAGLEVVWTGSYEEALETARKKPGTRLLVELRSPGCGECDRQEALVVPSTSFFNFMRDKVPVRLDIGSPDGKKLAERFGIPDVPAWLVLTTDGLLCGVQAGIANQGTWFETFVKTEQSWADYRMRLEEERKDPADIVLVYSVAEETYKRGGDELAEPRFRRLAENPEAPRKVKETSLAYLASIEMDGGRIEEAEKDLNTLLGFATDQMLRERAELRLADVAIARGRKDLAVARLRQFRKDHPSSTLVGQAEELLRALGAPMEVQK